MFLLPSGYITSDCLMLLVVYYKESNTNRIIAGSEKEGITFYYEILFSGMLLGHQECNNIILSNLRADSTVGTYHT